MNKDITEMRRELIRLVHLREGLVGIDLKRTNYKIAELQNRIDRVESQNRYHIPESKHYQEE